MDPAEFGRSWAERMSPRQQGLSLLVIGTVVGVGAGTAAAIRVLSTSHPYVRAVVCAGAIVGLFCFLIDRWSVDRASRSTRQASLNERNKTRLLKVALPIGAGAAFIVPFLPSVGMTTLFAVLAGLFLPYSIWIGTRLVFEPEWFDELTRNTREARDAGTDSAAP